MTRFHADFSLEAMHLDKEYVLFTIFECKCRESSKKSRLNEVWFASVKIQYKKKTIFIPFPL